MLLTADMGVGYDDHSLYHWPTPRALATARHLIAEGTSGSHDGEGDLAANLALHIGDIAYGTGYLAKWDRFMEQMEPLAKRVPYMVRFGSGKCALSSATCYSCLPLRPSRHIPDQHGQSRARLAEQRSNWRFQGCHR